MPGAKLEAALGRVGKLSEARAKAKTKKTTNSPKDSSGARGNRPKAKAALFRSTLEGPTLEGTKHIQAVLLNLQDKPA